MNARAGGRSVLAVVRSRSGGDGVAYVGRLLELALRAIDGEPPTIVALDATGVGSVGLWDRLRFLAKLTWAQRRRPRNPVVFNHVGIARAEQRVPRWIRRPYAVFLHGVEVWERPLDSERLAVVRAAAVRLSNSHFTARRVSEVNGKIGKVFACPLALLPDIPPATASACEKAQRLLFAGGLHVVIVGRMSATERYKGHDEILDVWPQVVASEPRARLLIVGRGDDAERLRTRAKVLGIEETIRFTGFLDDDTMRALLSESDVYAMPSRGEGFGLAYLEAMRAGLPCIGSTADAAVDLIVDGETGVLVPWGDRGALTHSLVRLLADEGLRRRMGAAARRREAAEFSFGSFTRAVATALDRQPDGQLADGPTLAKR